MTYAYYRDVYRGADVPETQFSTWVLRAEERLSADTCGHSDGVLLTALTTEQGGTAWSPDVVQTVQAVVGGGTKAVKFGTVENVSAAGMAGNTSVLSELVRRAVCAVADILYRTHEEESARGPLVRETVGGWSRSYTACDTRAAARQVRAAETLYLGSTGLLYRGR